MCYNKNIFQEVILSFNEISLTSGIEIAHILSRMKGTLTLVDLNGNKFGVDGTLEIKEILQPLKNYLSTMRLVTHAHTITYYSK